MSELITHVTDATFATEVLQVNDKIVVVDFWASWCGPCRMLAPHLEACAADMADRVKVTKYNVDESSAIASENNIRGIPTLLVYKNGQIVGQHTGFVGKDQLKSFIEQYL